MNTELIAIDDDRTVYLRRFHVVGETVIDIMHRVSNVFSSSPPEVNAELVRSANIGYRDIDVSTWSGKSPSVVAIGRVVAWTGSSERKCIVLDSSKTAKMVCNAILAEKDNAIHLWSGLIDSGLRDYKFAIAPAGHSIV